MLTVTYIVMTDSLRKDTI